MRKIILLALCVYVGSWSVNNDAYADHCPFSFFQSCWFHSPPDGNPFAVVNFNEPLAGQGIGINDNVEIDISTRFGFNDNGTIRFDNNFHFVRDIDYQIRNRLSGLFWTGNSWTAANVFFGGCTSSNPCIIEPGAQFLNHTQIIASSALGQCNCDLTVRLHQDIRRHVTRTSQVINFQVDLSEPVTILTHPEGTYPDVAFIAGSTIDDGPVGGREGVSIYVVDKVQNLRWHPENEQWTTWSSWDLDLFPSGAFATTFTDRNNPGSGAYTVFATAFDNAGNRDSTSSQLDFQLSVESPTPEIMVPAQGQAVNSTSRISGTADDDRAVAKVLLAIRDQNTGMYFRRTSGEFENGFHQFSAFGEPVKTGIDWSFEWRFWFFEPDNGSGEYELTVQAIDYAGVVGVQSAPAVEFTGENDLIPPSLEITVPIANEVVTNTQQVIAGQVDDNLSGVDRVEVSIVDLGTQLSLSFDGSVFSWSSGSQPQSFLADLTNPLSNTDWTFWDFASDFSCALGSGSYEAEVTAYDAAGNSTVATVQFQVDCSVIQ